METGYEASADSTTDEQLIGDLVLALLSVNLWTLDRTFGNDDGLKREGLFDMARVAGLTDVAVFARLERAGYDRGDFMIGLLGGRPRRAVGVPPADQRCRAGSREELRGDAGTVSSEMPVSILSVARNQVCSTATCDLGRVRRVPDTVGA